MCPCSQQPLSHPCYPSDPSSHLSAYPFPPLKVMTGLSMAMLFMAGFIPCQAWLWRCSGRVARVGAAACPLLLAVAGFALSNIAVILSQRGDPAASAPWPRAGAPAADPLRMLLRFLVLPGALALTRPLSRPCHSPAASLTLDPPRMRGMEGLGVITSPPPRQHQCPKAVGTNGWGGGEVAAMLFFLVGFRGGWVAELVRAVFGFRFVQDARRFLLRGLRSIAGVRFGGWL